MRHDHRPFLLLRAVLAFEDFWVRHFLAPRMDGLGEGHLIRKPWYVQIRGFDVSAGPFFHIVADRARPVEICGWGSPQEHGAVVLGAHCLILPGVRIQSAARIEIGDDCMVAAGAYITDADWHGLYDRTHEGGARAPVVLGKNVWIGEGACVLKGVTIGENSVVGARAVVAEDVPANVVVAGNPARVVKELDPAEPRKTMGSLFQESPEQVKAQQKYIQHLALAKNSWAGWLRTLLFPRRSD